MSGLVDIEIAMHYRCKYLPDQTIFTLLIAISQNHDLISIPDKIWEPYWSVVLCLHPSVDGQHLQRVLAVQAEMLHLRM